jgi:membrane protease YdiL (CAAX protease family)
MALDGSFTPLSALVDALLLGFSVYVYVALSRQIGARSLDAAPALTRGFTWGDAVLAALLATWFGLNITASASQRAMTMESRDLIANALFSIALLLFVASFLRVRGIDVKTLAGFAKLGFRRAFTTGTVLLLAAYPLIVLADAITQRVVGRSSERQGIVELFNGSRNLEQRVLIILLAVVIAPIAEEFLFRFFLYGVLKRYFGRVLALIGNALLFAAVHSHMPSFAPLFVLGTCFTIAFEWSGSILVSMTMHALFNALTLISLAFPEFIQQ